MAWDDIAGYETELSQALEAFNWTAAEAVCERLVARIKRESDTIPDGPARSILQRLRRKRRFALMSRLAEAMLQSGLRAPTVRRQYAQSLIDQGLLYAAEAVLQTIFVKVDRHVGEEAEARGLLGRVYKQLYVNRNDPQSDANRANLERAVKEYRAVFDENQMQFWHGVNAVALLARARRDEVPLEDVGAAEPMAEFILQLLDQRERDSTEGLTAWDYATAMEAHLALGRHAEAAAAASRYAMSEGADAFELASTIRQLTEVWQLNEQEPPGNLILPICKAAYLRKQGAVLEGDSTQVRKGADAAGGALESLADDGKGLEKVFGPDTMVTLAWYKKGLEQCNAIARVETPNRRGYGTGWLVEASDFFPDRRGPLLLTNDHVISDDDQHPFAILPDGAWANFQALDDVVELGDVVWGSPYNQLDATFVSLKREPKARPLALHTRPVQMTKPPKAPPRMYIIGHPAGRDLEISLQDNSLLATNERVLHYRTPTEPGSSGSPVFEPDDWRVVALHHKGSDTLKRIDGEEGTYPANEGIAIPAIQQRTREHKGS